MKTKKSEERSGFNTQTTSNGDMYFLPFRTVFGQSTVKNAGKDLVEIFAALLMLNSDFVEGELRC